MACLAIVRSEKNVDRFVHVSFCAGVGNSFHSSQYRPVQLVGRSPDGGFCDRRDDNVENPTGPSGLESADSRLILGWAANAGDSDSWMTPVVDTVRRAFVRCPNFFIQMVA